jgi:hypothetical protein
MADRDNHEPYDFDDDHRWRDHERERGRGFESERPSWTSDDRGRGYHEGGTYGQRVWRGSAQRSLMHDDQRYGPHHDTGEAWGQDRDWRDQGREDFGRYGQTGAGAEHGYRSNQHGDASRQFGPGGYGRGAGRGPGDFAGQGGSAFGAGGYPAYGRREPHMAGREFAGDFEPEYGQGRPGGHPQPYPGQAHRREASGGQAPHGDFEPDYLHWRENQMRKLDEDYHRWREERRSKFAQDFDEWRRRRGGQASTKAAVGAPNSPMVSHVSDGETDLYKDDRMPS